MAPNEIGLVSVETPSERRDQNGRIQWLGLRRSHRFQGRHPLEGLYHADEDIQAKRQHGRDHVDDRPGDLVAVLGLGGLGHLGIQFAAKMGFETVAIARGKDEEPLARELGARHYIDGQAQDAAAELVRLGGASVILATAPSGKAMSALVNGREREARRRRGARRPAGGAGSVADRGASLDRGLAVRHLDRLRGHDGLQRPCGSGGR